MFRSEHDYAPSSTATDLEEQSHNLFEGEISHHGNIAPRGKRGKVPVLVLGDELLGGVENVAGCLLLALMNPDLCQTKDGALLLQDLSKKQQELRIHEVGGELTSKSKDVLKTAGADEPRQEGHVRIELGMDKHQLDHCVAQVVKRLIALRRHEAAAHVEEVAVRAIAFLCDVVMPSLQEELCAKRRPNAVDVCHALIEECIE
jgi:hypothetical protein